MTQYYYSDPLAAAWQAKHFGIDIYTHRLDNGVHPKRYRDFNESVADIAKNVVDGWQDRYYVYPDSLPLLEPQIGDWVAVFSGKASIGSWPDEVTSIHRPNDETYPYAGDGRLVVGLEGCHPDWKYFDDCKIIQRDGKAFHWPERDAAESVNPLP